MSRPTTTHARMTGARGHGPTHLMRDARGQASVELIAGLPALLLAGVIALQLLAVGYSLTLADGAAEAGALAVAVGRPAQPAVEEALPGWADKRVDVEVDGGEVSVSLRPPSPLAGISNRLAVTSSSWVRRPAEE